MDAPFVIRAEGLSKMYRIGRKRSQSLRETIAHKFSSTFFPSAHEVREYWALQDVSFRIRQGEVTGIIGRNGAGKSTLLKILSRITEPTEGKAVLEGRVASLLEVGTGFHPELTGRENVFMNGAILGMKKAEIRRQFDAIVDFSGIEEFIDTPVKRYSSGMYVRLAFAVAAHLEPEILIVDEVLAVGDAGFQRKCLGKMKDVTQQQGRTMLFVSHNMQAMVSICTEGIWLDQGRIRSMGKIAEITSQYMEQFSDTVWRQEFPTSAEAPKITSVELDPEKLKAGEFYLRISFESPFALRPPVPGFVVYNEAGIPVFGSNPRIHASHYEISAMDKGTLAVSVKEVPLYSGPYFISVWLGDFHADYDFRHHAITFSYLSPEVYTAKITPSEIGSVDPKAKWFRE